MGYTLISLLTWQPYIQCLWNCFNQHTISELDRSSAGVKCFIPSETRLRAALILLWNVGTWGSPVPYIMYEYQSHLCQIKPCLFTLKRHSERAWPLVIIGAIPRATLCSLSQNKVEFITDVSSHTGLAELTTFHLYFSTDQTVLHNGQNMNYGQTNTDISFACRSTRTCWLVPVRHSPILRLILLLFADAQWTQTFDLF